MLPIRSLPNEQSNDRVKACPSGILRTTLSLGGLDHGMEQAKALAHDGHCGRRFAT
jgi:hypothetical protein